MQLRLASTSMTDSTSTSSSMTDSTSTSTSASSDASSSTTSSMTDSTSSTTTSTDTTSTSTETTSTTASTRKVELEEEKDATARKSRTFADAIVTTSNGEVVDINMILPTKVQAMPESR